ncbi:hypothetical protein [Pontibacter sp. H249]|uniref:hypothetical protein n=1 Tax=Pontibacter sp. H249 TaxID=3133420 RepID=UPI0030C5A0FC
MSEPALSGLGRKALKTAGIVIAGMAVLVLVAVVALYFLAEPLVEHYLKKQVVKQTEGLYHINFDDLQLHLLTRSITLKGVSLYPDTAAHHRQKETGHGSRTLLDVQSPKISITRINLADMLFRKRLSINSVIAERPVITQLLDESVAKIRSPGKESSGNLNAVSIQGFSVKKAKYQYLVLGQQNRPRHEVSQFSLLVHDLRLNLQEQEGLLQMLHAGALDLSLQDYTFQTPDSVYTVQVRRLFYSSRQQVLKVRDVAVQPDFYANMELPRSKRHRILYQFRTLLLSLQGLDVAAAWGTKQLQLDRLLLEHTNLNILEDLTIPDSVAFPGLAKLYADLSPYLKEISIKQLCLTDGSFKYRQKSTAIQTIHSLERADIYLQSLQLDSATLFTPKQKSFAAAIGITTKNYTYSPRNSPYTLKTGSMELSTQDKSLQVGALHLTGDWNKNDKLKRLNKARRTFYNISLPHLQFNDMDLLQALRTSRLAIGTITAEQPVIDVRTDLLVHTQDAGPDLEAMYRQVSGLINKLQVGEISITDAALTHHNKARSLQLLQQLDHASLSATGLLVDSAFIFQPDLKLPLQDMVIRAKMYRHQMPDHTYTFVLADLRYSTRRQEFSAQSIDLISSTGKNARQRSIQNTSRNIFNLSANALRVTGLDLVKAINTRRLEADQLLLRQPHMAILLNRKVIESKPGQKERRKGLFKFIDMISVTTIQLEDGSFTLNEKLEPVMRTHLLEHATGTVSGLQLTSASFENLSEALPIQELDLLAKNYTYRTTDSLYVIKLDSLHYSSRQQEVIAHTFTVNADRGVNERLKAEKPHLASRNMIDISAKRSRITGFNLIHAYATGQYHMSKLLLAGPKVTILQDHNVTPATVRAPAGQDTAVTSNAMQQLTNLVTTFRVDRLEVADGTFDFHILEDTIRISQTLEHVALEIDQLQLVSLEASDPLEIFDVNNINILVQGYTFFTGDSLYAVEVKEMRASMSNRSLAVDSLRLRPLFSKEQYATLFRYARDRIDLTVPEIEMQGISLRALFNNQDIVAHNMLIRNPVMEIYRDNRLGFDPDIRPPTLQSALRGAGVYINLDTIQVEKNYLVHPVIGIDGMKPAVFMLDDIRMQAYNITNDTTLIRRNNMLTVNASALFMGVSTLQANFQFQLDHPEDRYTYEGTLEPMDFKALNPLLENLVFIRIKSGQIHKAAFKIEATGNEATGQVHFPYNNLKVQLLSKHDPNNPGLVLKAGTRLINIFVIKSNNPSSWGKFREGDVKEARDPKRSVSYHISQSMLDGVTSSLMTKLVRRIVSRFVDF